MLAVRLWDKVGRWVFAAAHPQMALTAEMRTDGGWLSWRPLTVACRNCWMSSGDMAAVKRLAAHSARPSRKGDAAGRGEAAGDKSRH